MILKRIVYMIRFKKNKLYGILDVSILDAAHWANITLVRQVVFCLMAPGSVLFDGAVLTNGGVSRWNTRHVCLPESRNW